MLVAMCQMSTPVGKSIILLVLGIKLGGGATTGGDPGQIYKAWTNVASDGSLLRLEPRFRLASILIAVAWRMALHPYSITAQDGYTGIRWRQRFFTRLLISLQFAGVYISAFICWLLAVRWRLHQHIHVLTPS
jgi:hypothetical protein